MKISFGFFKSFLFLIISAFIVNIITWPVIYYKIRPSSEIVPLHYNIFYGPDLAGKGYYIYLLPGAALLLLISDLIIFKYVKAKQSFGAKALVIAGFLVQLIVFAEVLFLKSIII